MFDAVSFQMIFTRKELEAWRHDAGEMELNLWIRSRVNSQLSSEALELLLSESDG